MKSILSLFASAVMSVLCCFAVIAHGAQGDCAKEKSSKVSKRCLHEIERSMSQDRVSQAVRKALETSYSLKTCIARDAGKLEIAYAADDAVGPTLTVSSYVSCSSESEADGYVLTGEYFIDGGGYRFKQISLSTFE